MKFFVLFIICCALRVDLTSAKLIPDRLPQPCSISTSNYSTCMFEVLKKLGPHLLTRGVPELKLPKFDPLTIPLFPINNTASEFVGMTGSFKDMQFWGFETTYIDHFAFDTDSLKGELRMKHPQSETLLEFDIVSWLFSYELRGTGFFASTTTNMDALYSFSLKPFEKAGVKHYALKDFRARSVIHGGHIQIVSTSGLQDTAELITNFFNANPVTVLTLMRPIVDEGLARFYRGVVDQMLNIVPAEELFPE